MRFRGGSFITKNRPFDCATLYIPPDPFFNFFRKYSGLIQSALGDNIGFVNIRSNAPFCYLELNVFSRPGARADV